MNASSSSWFFLWVPSRAWERDKRSRSRCSEDSAHQLQPRERSCSQGRSTSPGRRSCSAAPLDPEDVETLQIHLQQPQQQQRPVLQSLPAIQEHQDLFLPRPAGRLTCTVIPVPESGVNSGDSSSGVELPQSICGSTTSTLSTATASPVAEELPRALLQSVDPGTGGGPSATAAAWPLGRPVPEYDQEKLAKQESYDSHYVRREPDSAASTTTPLTPHTPMAANPALLFPNNDERDCDHNNFTVNSTMSFVKREPLEDICRKLLDRLNISPVNIQPSADDHQVLFSFFVPSELVEAVLLELQNQGIGQTADTSVSVVPAAIHHSNHALPSPANLLGRKNSSEGEKLDKFYSSVKSRLLVAEVIARIQAGAEFSFDFLLLLLLASAIAFMGLVESSSVVLVASMLVSPLMGPILAGIFGGVIQDVPLTRKGVRNETKALLICICMGFLLGLVISPFPRQYGCTAWPTSEMLARGELRSLWVGMLIAVPSGAGVALSVLGGNAGSLVGVAISASLLPPAVNAGLFWALAFVLAVGGSDVTSFYGHHYAATPPDWDTLLNQTLADYTTRYFDNYAAEAFVLGLVSLTLTLINILCIILTGVFILWIKGVTPEKVPQKFSNFWRKDVKAHRNYYRTLKTGDNQKLLNELQALGLAKKQDEGLEGTFIHSMFERAAMDADLIDIKQWVTMPASALPPKQRTPRPSESDEEDFNSANERTEFLLRSESHLVLPPPLLLRMRSVNHQICISDPLQPYATYHCSGPERSNPTFLNVPGFFQSELRRTMDYRRRLHSGGDQPVPV